MVYFEKLLLVGMHSQGGIGRAVIFLCLGHADDQCDINDSLAPLHRTVQAVTGSSATESRLAGWRVNPIGFKKLGGKVARAMTAIVAILLGLRIPNAPTPGIDSSWQLVLSRAHQLGLHSGTDIVFTYGPLGFLENDVQLPELFWTQIAWQLVTRVAAMILLVAWVSKASLMGRFIVIGFLFAVLPGGANGFSSIPLEDAYCFFVIWLASAHLLVGRPGFNAITMLSVGSMAAFSLEKFPYAVGAALCVGMSVATSCWERQWMRAVKVGGLFVIALSAGWLAAGQSLRDVPAYLGGSYRIVSGYADAMASQWSYRGPLNAVLAVAVVALLLSLLWAKRGAAHLCAQAAVGLSLASCLMIKPHTQLSSFAQRSVATTLTGVFLLLLLRRFRHAPFRRRGTALWWMTAALAALILRHSTTRMDIWHLSCIFVWTILV
jgi:hypothetical protein